jgi:hypothetical protein
VANQVALCCLRPCTRQAGGLKSPLAFMCCRRQQVAKLQKIDAAAALYPVSVVFDPTFDMFTHLVGHGDRQSGWDVSSALTTHGGWQPSVQPSRRPSLADALVGSLGIAPNSVLVGAWCRGCVEWQHGLASGCLSSSLCISFQYTWGLAGCALSCP